MMKNAVSQLPVLDRSRVVGTITEESIVGNLRLDLSNEKVSYVTGPPLPITTEESCIDTMLIMLKTNDRILVIKRSRSCRITSLSDLLKTIA
jgi:predicted transcriptional regulator